MEILVFAIGNKATSRNSSLPPSRDPFRLKPTREKSGRKPGGQKGHEGSTLELTDNPDKTIVHQATHCDSCGAGLKSTPVSQTTRHQIIDIDLRKTIVEHQVEHKFCSCGHHQAHAIAQGAPAQYGPHVKAMAVELNQVQCLPVERTSAFIREKFLLSLSPATILSFRKTASEKLEVWQEKIRNELLAASALHADETGINIDGKNWWAHTLSTENATLILVNKKRGSQAMIEAEILPQYKGILCHDFWASYGKFDAVHAACHAHLQRELTRVHEEYKQAWAKELKKLLLDANEERKDNDGVLPYDRIQYYEHAYSNLVKKGGRLNPAAERKKAKTRGRIAQVYPKRLLERLRKYRDWVLLFLYDPRVPFTNNQAERDIRMLKVQQKTSGCFRTEKGAQDHCRIRSYILTKEKQGLTKHQALAQLFGTT